jgi:hypothetical protein
MTTESTRDYRQRLDDARGRGVGCGALVLTLMLGLLLALL